MIGLRRHLGLSTSRHQMVGNIKQLRQLSDTQPVLRQLRHRPGGWGLQSVSPPVRTFHSTVVSSALSSRLGAEPSAVGYNDYDTERKTFRLEQPEYYNFATDVIDRWALVEQVVFTLV